MITRDILHRELKIMVGDESWNRKQIIDGIDRAKSYLINERGAHHGQKIFITSIPWPSYLIWFMAGAELGMSFITTDPLRMIVGSFSVREKVSLYGEIDHIIGNDDVKNFCKNFRKIPSIPSECIDQFAWVNYPISDTPIWATRDTIIINSTSSGTASLPKVCSHTHGFFYDLMIRNINVLALNEDDMCLHTKILHHGSVVGVYFLPSLYKCKNHRWTEHELCIETIQTYNINRALLFYDNIDDIPNKMVPAMRNDNVTLYVLSSVPKHIVEHVTKKMKYTIVSIYGCTETSGPVMLSTASPNDEYDWNPMIFAGPLDDFYRLSVNNDLISITMPDGSTITPGDRFYVNRRGWVLRGRENLYRRNGETIYLGVLASWLESQFGWKYQESFDLVFDQDKERIYLRADPGLIESLGAINRTIKKHFNDVNYQIDRMIEGPRIDFYTGIKFDANEVRLKCRLL